LRNELLNREIFITLEEAKVLISNGEWNIIGYVRIVLLDIDLQLPRLS
jgi:hypothetical protein